MLSRVGLSRLGGRARPGGALFAPRAPPGAAAAGAQPGLGASHNPEGCGGGWVFAGGRGGCGEGARALGAGHGAPISRGFAMGSFKIPDYANRENLYDDGPEQVTVVGKVTPGEHNTAPHPGGEGYQVLNKDVFAVVEVGGHQFKVATDDVIVSEKLKGVEVNDVVSLKRVLMLGTVDETVIGRPFVPGEVMAACEEQFQEAKKIIFKKKRRKNYRRHQGHRQQLTRLRILDIVDAGANLAAA